MRALDEMKIVAKRREVLAALRANRETHAKIVAEARRGYLQRAAAELQVRLDKIRAGKVVNISTPIALPADYTNVYDTAIKMLELHQGEEVTLNSNQVRNLIQDEWDWSKHFIDVSSAYSGTARERAIEEDT